MGAFRAALWQRFIKRCRCQPRHNNTEHQAGEYVRMVDLAFKPLMRQHHIAAKNIDQRTESAMSIMEQHLANLLAPYPATYPSFNRLI